MSDRMTDERLAEIETCHAEVEPVDITDTWFYFEELPSYTTEIAHKQRGELLQALKAERQRIKELKALLEQWAVFWGDGKADIQMQDLYADTLEALEEDDD